MSKFKEDNKPKLVRLLGLVVALLYLFYLLFIATGIQRDDFPLFKK